MFIRIKKRTNSRQRIMVYYVAKATRVNGKPRQRIVCYLGSIRERLAGEAHIQRYLWRKARAALDRAGLSRRQRQEVERKLAAIVPRPTAASRRAAEARLAALMAGLH